MVHLKWNPEIERDKTFVIDTPPPIVSGSLHIGHVFSYTHQDIIVRQRRMMGMNIYYPIVWDDNGLPTESRVQHYYNVYCDPDKTYEGTSISAAPKKIKNPQCQFQEKNSLNYV
jgi:valyl-tRNA synthetase